MSNNPDNKPIIGVDPTTGFGVSCSGSKIRVMMTPKIQGEFSDDSFSVPILGGKIVSSEEDKSQP